DDDAHAGAVALVAHFGDAFDLLGADQFGDALQETLLVNLIGNFVDDDRETIFADFLELGARADDDRITAGFERALDPIAADDDAAGRKIRTRHDLYQLFQRHVRIGDQR